MYSEHGGVIIFILNTCVVRMHTSKIWSLVSLQLNTPYMTSIKITAFLHYMWLGEESYFHEQAFFFILVTVQTIVSTCNSFMWHSHGLMAKHVLFWLLKYLDISRRYNHMHPTLMVWHLVSGSSNNLHMEFSHRLLVSLHNELLIHIILWMLYYFIWFRLELNNRFSWVNT